MMTWIENLRPDIRFAGRMLRGIENLLGSLKTMKPCAAPIIRWAGSKRKLIPVLMSRAPVAYTRYVEPFAGSACLFFALNPRRAIRY